MIKIPARIQSLPAYIPGKPIEAVAAEYNINPENLAKLASNENPLGTPTVVRETIAASLNKLHLYPDDQAQQLRDKIAAKYGMDPRWVILGNGSVELIEMAARAFLDDSDSAMFSQYGFAIYKTATLASNHDYQEIPARDDLGHNLDLMLHNIKPSTKLIYIANPNNPTGNLIKRRELDHFLKSVPDNVLVLLDEAYFEFVDDPEYQDGIHYLSDLGMKNLIVTRTFSKAFGLAALRVGYGFAHPEIIDTLEKVRTRFNINFLAQVACIRALDCEDHIRDSMKQVRDERNFLVPALTELGLKVYGDAGNFLLIDLGRPVGPVFHQMQQQGIIVRPLGGYDLPNFMRLTLGTRSENERCLAALKRVL